MYKYGVVVGIGYFGVGCIVLGGGWVADLLVGGVAGFWCYSGV